MTLFASEPLYVTIILSLLLFVPLIAVQNFDLLTDSAFARALRGAENTVVLYSSVVMCISLLVDTLLDMLTYKSVDFVEFRFASVASLVFVSVLTIVFRDYPQGIGAMLTLYIVGFFFEFAIILILLNRWIPQFCSKVQCNVLLVLIFVYLLILVLNCISVFDHYALFIAFYATLSVISVLLSFIFLRVLYAFYQNYKQAGLPLTKYWTRLESDFASALVLLSSAFLAFGAFIIMYIFFVPNFPYIPSLSDDIVLFIEVVRTALCLTTYIIPARIYRAKLLQSEKDVEVKMQFIQYISHEMRTPLSVIATGLDLIDPNPIVSHATPTDWSNDSNQPREPRHSKKVKAHIKYLKKSCAFCFATLDNLLLYEQIETGTMQLHIVSSPPIETFKKLFKTYNTSTIRLIDQDYSDDNPGYISVDYFKLQLVLNALINPILESPSKASEILIEIKDTYAATNEAASNKGASRIMPSYAPTYVNMGVLVVIKDPRKNLNPADFDLISSDTSRLLTRQGGHDGKAGAVGLYLARKFMELHGGTIRVLLDEHRALSYHLWLPLELDNDFNYVESGLNDSIMESVMDEAEGHAGINDFQGFGPVQSNQQLQFGGGPDFADRPGHRGSIASYSSIGPDFSSIKFRILIVDDSKMIRKMMTMMLTSLGHDCKEVSDGIDAVESVRVSLATRQPYDMVLLDNQMEIMMGNEAAQRIRDDLKYDGVIIGVTGNSSVPDIEDFVRHGANEVIIKPLTVEKFIEAVLRYPAVIVAAGSRLGGRNFSSG